MLLLTAAVRACTPLRPALTCPAGRQPCPLTPPPPPPPPFPPSPPPTPLVARRCRCSAAT
ncbi:hypothetical protein C1N81_32315 [Streptomyces sp. SGAir0957]